jgi:hypothetical protein
MAFWAFFQAKILWFPQVFEDEGGLASGEVVLHLVVASLLQVGI